MYFLKTFNYLCGCGVHQKDQLLNVVEGRNTCLCKNHTEHINALHGQNTEFLMLNLMLFVVTIMRELEQDLHE